MWKDVFSAYIRIGTYSQSQLIEKLDVLNNAGELQNGEYQEILTIINAAFA